MGIQDIINTIHDSFDLAFAITSILAVFLGIGYFYI